MKHQRVKTDPTGFTLLEVLIASGLATTLMLLVWSLFSVYSKLNDKGDSQATELQLVRSLMRQMRCDLHHTRSNAERPAESLPQFQDRPVIRSVGEMRGGESWLQMVVRAPRDGDEAGMTPPREDREGDSADVCEMVRYDWRSGRKEPSEREPERHLEEQSEEPSEQQLIDPVGLTRRVLPRVMRRDPQVKQEDRVPEVTKLRFRYFDGRAWHKGWESGGRGLPAAIEVAFDLQSEAGRKRLEMEERSESERERLIEKPQPFVAHQQDARETFAARKFEYRFVIAVNVKDRAEDHEETILP